MVEVRVLVMLDVLDAGIFCRERLFLAWRRGKRSGVGETFLSSAFEPVQSRKVRLRRREEWRCGAEDVQLMQEIFMPFTPACRFFQCPAADFFVNWIRDGL
jgi:hypothetical protein